MRKIILALLSIFTFTVHAQHYIATGKAEGLSSTQRAVGYIVDNTPDSITTKGVFIGASGDYPVAVLATDDMLSNYIGCKVIGIRVAAAQSLGKSELFLYPVSGGMVSEEGITKSQRLYEGWNNVFFNGDTSWEIQEGQQLLVGFEYKETDAMVDAGKGGLCTVGESQGNDFLVMGDFGSGQGWYGFSGLGSLCVQLIVDVSSLPARELTLAYVDTGFRYKKAGENIEMYIIAANTGLEDIDHYTLSCQLDEQSPQQFTYNQALPEQGNAHLQPVITLPANLPIGEHHLTVTLLDGENAEPLNEKATETVTFYVYEQTVERQKTYVEQYTSQQEYMTSIVDPIFNQVADNNPSMVLVNVYAPGEPLAVPEASYLHELYAYTLPSFTSNRSYFPGESYIAYDVNYYAEQYAAFVPSIINDIIMQDLLQPAFATVNLSASYNEEERLLTIDTSGELVEGATEILGTPAITLLLTENNVVGQQTVLNKITGRTKVQNDYTHQHVLRTFITPPLGDAVNISGQQYTAHHTITLDPAWNVNNMTLVAFITRSADAVTDDNVLQMDITNCNSISLAGLTSIKPIHADEAMPYDGTEYYTLDGRRLTSFPSQKGIYIYKGKKVIVK